MHRPRPTARLGAVVLAVVTMAGCSGPAGLGPPRPDPPEAGSSLVACELAADDGPLTFFFVLEDGYTSDPESESGPGCTWRRPDTLVEVFWIGDGGSLRDVYDVNAALLDEDGDDVLSDLRLAEDVIVFGETTGDRLRWDCDCDGRRTVTYQSQAGGVRLLWSGPAVLQDQIEDEVRTALASAGAG